MNPVLRVSDLTVRFGGLTAVDRVRLDIDAGQIHGLIGPNGAGKTTFFNAVSGLVPAHAGSLALAGKTITTAPAHVRARLGIRRTFQALQLSPHLTVLENVMFGLHSEIRENPLRTILNFSVRKSADWLAQARARQTLENLGIGDLALEPAGRLPFAQQRQVELARALVAAPKLLMLDEPAAGLSPAEIEQLDRMLVRLCKESGVAILLVEHVISLVMNVCERVTVLDRGSVIAHGSPTQVAADPSVRQAYLGDGNVAAD